MCIVPGNLPLAQSSGEKQQLCRTKGINAFFFGASSGRALPSSVHGLVVPPDPRMLQPTWRRRGGGCWLVGAVRARANCVQHPSKTQLLFPCRAWVIAALAAPLRARGREAAQSLAPEPAQSQERLLLNFSGLWLRQEKRGCFEKDAAYSPLQLCFVCQRWAPLAGAEQG